MARCPVHEDHDASLSISEGKDGRVLLNCFGCGKTEEILAAKGLRMRDLFPVSHGNGARSDGSRVTNYEYRDANGRLVAIKRRRDSAGRKAFGWRRPCGAQGLGGTPVADLPLYSLLELLKAPLDESVFIVEGEKACDAVRARGLIAVCAPGEPGRRGFHRIVEPLRGHHVVLWPDNDDPGRRFMARIAAALDGVAATVRWLEVADLRAKDDAYDYFAAGGSAEELRRAGSNDSRFSIQDSAPAPIRIYLRNSKDVELAQGNRELQYRQSQDPSNPSAQTGRHGTTVIGKDQAPLLPGPAPQQDEPGANVEAAILTAFGADHPTEGEIRRRVGGNQRFVALGIRRLCARGVLSRTGRGVRGDPYRYFAKKSGAADPARPERGRADSNVTAEAQRRDNDSLLEDLLRLSEEEWTLCEERAAILEYDAGLSREEAERQAFEWLARRRAAPEEAEAPGARVTMLDGCQCGRLPTV
jgi:hypothetical protein